MGTKNGIRRIVRLWHMLRKWCNKARSPSSSRALSNIPAGHVAIYAAAAGREGCGMRFVACATSLNHPVFAKLLSEAAEEYGFGHDGPMTIPCDKSVFEDVIWVASGSVREMSRGKDELFQPWVLGLVQKPVW